MHSSGVKKLLALMVGVCLISGGMAYAQDNNKTLRIVPQADLKILDPIWTTAFSTRAYGYMVYDTLFGMDAQNKVQPEMVQKYEVSDDRMVWTFTLRDKLFFSDGNPVTSADVIASLQRWGQRDPLGQRMLAAVDKFDAVSDSTFRITLNHPFGMVLDALAKPSSVPAFIMPERVAKTPANQQISETTGSGPYMLKSDEYRPGEKVVFVKNPHYVARDEAPSGTAGGKHVYVDRLEWIILKDAQTQANALSNGEVDMIEWLPSEQYAAMQANPKITLESQTGLSVGTLHINHLIPPFNNPDIAKAALMALNQEAIMRAQQVHKELYSTCVSIYPCGTEFASDITNGFTGEPRFDEAKALLKKAGYDGTPVVLLQAADFSMINKYPLVAAALLRQAGFTVDLQSMDWSSLVTRRTNQGGIAQGGWHIFITTWGMADSLNPMFMPQLTGNGTKGFFGWATDPQLEQLKDKFQAAASEEERKALATQIQQRVFDAAIFAPIGNFRPMVAYRKGVVSGLVPAPVTVLWNLKKN
ncbi:peptide ABC transporter substrate-binding protein [Brenneria goodwinii]|uniref:Peptide ABC transporter substrate-binding protein n=1 Tax=Brenneria goodwinii TaxID=1109412 RepID=A0AAE8EMU5_9GAMM|nr:ABC transporter substrate-binding protein [Brenneria goodwinii]ATA23286.1 peptide ABC transporter substrate-binding protein [Brenneria goodwinii]RLM22058.1 peptide ABC transporter substrate-binding protein [Brenneria goodwinii]